MTEQREREGTSSRPSLAVRNNASAQRRNPGSSMYLRAWWVEHRDSENNLPPTETSSKASCSQALPSENSCVATMSEERSKISLRSGPKRKGRPTISAPRQISSPMPQDEAVKSSGGRPVEPAPRTRLRPPPVTGGKVCGRRRWPPTLAARS